MKKDSNYRPNPQRAIWVDSVLSDELLQRLLPKVEAFRSESMDPITVYIHSDGGDVRVLDILYGLLTSEDQDGKVCRVITAVNGNAGSAAASLLSLGDYAIAYPNSSIHFHGVRMVWNESRHLTMELATSFAKWLSIRNNENASKLAHSFVGRLIFHFTHIKDTFPEPDLNNKRPPDIECFAEALKQHLSTNADRIVDRAIRRFKTIEEVVAYVQPKIKTRVRGRAATMAEFEASVLKGVIDYEIKKREGTDWTLDQDGVASVVEDYTILRDYYAGEHTHHTQQIASRYGFAFLSRDELQSWTVKNKESVEEGEKWLLETVESRIQPFWYFAIAICRCLHEAENPISPTDAYWLGAVDEVIGSGLPCLRLLMEEDDTVKTKKN